MIYKQIKKNEESPNAEYLFNNLDTKNNFERSLKQMEMLNSVDTMNIGSSQNIIKDKPSEEQNDDDNDV